MYGCVYMIRCSVNGKVYIGQTRVNLKSRKKTHLSGLRRNKHETPKLQNAFNKYGESAFQWFVLQDYVPCDKLDDLEIKWIKKFNAIKNGFNSHIGGNKPPINRHNAKPCEWNGKHYNSITEAAIENNTDVKILSRKISLGYKSDKDRKRNRSKNNFYKSSVVWNDIKYNSILECSEDIGYSYRTVCQWLKTGYKSNKDVPGFSTKKRNKIIWNDIEFKNISECAQYNNIPYSTMINRLNYGHSSDKDIVGVNKKVIIENICFCSFTLAAKYFGVSNHTITKWVKNGKAIVIQP